MSLVMQDQGHLYGAPANKLLKRSVLGLRPIVQEQAPKQDLV